MKEINRFGTKQKKTLCDRCKKKVTPKLKKREVGDVHFYFLHCGRCKAVYPAYVEDKWVRDKKAEVSQLQKRAWETDEVGLEEKVRLAKAIVKLQKEVEYVAKDLLVKSNILEFKNFGEEVIVR